MSPSTIVRVCAVICLLCGSVPCVVKANEAAEVARVHRLGNEQRIVDDFAELLRMPNVASDEVNIRRNANHIVKLMEARGFDMQLLEYPGSPPVVFGERKAPGADKTLVIYVHYDGQPVNAADWASDPWEPVLRNAMVEQGGEVLPMKAPFDPEWRIFGRAAGDDKAPIIALGAALDALDEAGIAPSVNLKLFFEGEEEAGSPHLEGMLEKHRDLLDADLWLFCDGPVHQSRSWQLVNGVRGSFGFDLTVYGPNRPLHSGHYGNWSPNPIVMLSELILSMRDGSGNILVDGYMDPVRAPTLQEMEAIENAPLMDDSLQREQGIAAPETSERLELAIMRPAINLRGIRSGDVGEAARNAIQTEATASIGLRLVPDLTPEYAREAIERHIAAQGYEILHRPANDGRPPGRQTAGLAQLERTRLPGLPQRLQSPADSADRLHHGQSLLRATGAHGRMPHGRQPAHLPDRAGHRHARCHPAHRQS